MPTRIRLPLAALALVALALGLLAALRGGDGGSVAGAPAAAPGPATPAATSLVAVPGELTPIAGRCPTDGGAPAGPVVIEELGGERRVTDTGVSGAAWTVEWRAPADGSTATLRIWCGDGAGEDFPADREIAVRYRTPAPPTTVAGQTLPPLPDT